MPSPSAAIVAKPVIVPDMSTTPVTTVTRPSASRRQMAEAGWRPPGHAPDGDPDPLAIGQRRPVAIERMVGQPDEAFVEPDPSPRRPVGHLVVGGDEVAPPELDRVDLEAAGQLVEQLLEGERRLGRAGRAVGAGADPVGLDPVGHDLVRVPVVRADGQDRGDPLDAVLGEAARLEEEPGAQAA